MLVWLEWIQFRDVIAENNDIFEFIENYNKQKNWKKNKNNIKDVMNDLFLQFFDLGQIVNNQNTLYDFI